MANVLLVSTIAPATPGTCALRIVLSEWDPGKQWATHIENMDIPGMGTGHYFYEASAAAADFVERCRHLGVQ
jgi:hypothetical protein